MRTVALRFAENFAPECGTIAAHQAMIDEFGFAWYGKFGSAISLKIAGDLLKEDDPKILLIHSGSTGRYWAHVCKIAREVPDLVAVPEYYRSMAEKVGCWFKITSFDCASKDVMSQCQVASSGKALSLASRHSMSPYFIIDYAAE